MNNFEQRLRRLERMVVRQGACSVCGHPFVPEGKQAFKVVYEHPPHEPLPLPAGPKPVPCKGCGRIDGQAPIDVVYTIRFDDPA